MSTTTGIKLDLSLIDRLKALGELKDRSPHWMMKSAIEEYVDREEKAESQRLEDQARWTMYETSGRSFDNDQVSAWLESIGTDSEKPCPG